MITLSLILAAYFMVIGYLAGRLIELLIVEDENGR